MNISMHSSILTPCIINAIQCIKMINKNYAMLWCRQHIIICCLAALHISMKYTVSKHTVSWCIGGGVVCLTTQHHSMLWSTDILCATSTGFTTQTDGLAVWDHHGIMTLTHGNSLRAVPLWLDWLSAAGVLNKLLVSSNFFFFFFCMMNTMTITTCTTYGSTVRSAF
uniref:Uncharacterized protein n=1 Tax=Diplonema sp. ATCC 50224 TaxID=91375 RepID=A0A2D2AJU6_9EUGL|nr:hypothetical protein [Diplonema sp. ATCC 50224]